MTTFRNDTPKFPTVSQFITVVICIIFILTLFCFGCGTKYKERRCRALNCCQIVKDSTVFIHTVKDSLIFIDESETWIDLLFQCDSANLVQLAKVDRLETENADLKFKYENGKLTVYVHKIDTVTGKNTESIVYKDKVIVKEVPAKLTKWQNFRLTAFPYMAAFVLLILVYIAYRIYRKFS